LADLAKVVNNDYGFMEENVENLAQIDGLSSVLRHLTIDLQGKGQTGTAAL
jgi:hypothetical protein